MGQFKVIVAYLAGPNTCRRREPYNSFGNGAAMRVSPVGFAFDRLDDVLTWAERSAAVTRLAPNGLALAQSGVHLGGLNNGGIAGSGEAVQVAG